MTPVRWISLHIYYSRSADDVILKGILPVLDREREERRLRRYFFIRYSEGGDHIRLRLQASAGCEEVLTQSLTEGLQHFSLLNELCARAEASIYDRTLHYFGESPLSVFAELINIATSSMAIRILNCSSPGKAVVFFRTGYVFRALMEGSGQAQAEAWTERWRRGIVFTIAAAQGLNGNISAEQATTQVLAGDFATALRSSFSPALQRELRRLLWLLLRCEGLEGGATVATHGLHLLCNKVGLNLQEENLLYHVVIQASSTKTRDIREFN